MRLIKIGDVHIVIDAIAALVPKEYDEGTLIMLLSGATLETDATTDEILDQIREALKDG